MRGRENKSVEEVKRVLIRSLGDPPHVALSSFSANLLLLMHKQSSHSLLKLILLIPILYSNSFLCAATQGHPKPVLREPDLQYAATAAPRAIGTPWLRATPYVLPTVPLTAGNGKIFLN